MCFLRDLVLVLTPHWMVIYLVIIVLVLMRSATDKRIEER